GIQFRKTNTSRGYWHGSIRVLVSTTPAKRAKSGHTGRTGVTTVRRGTNKNGCLSPDDDAECVGSRTSRYSTAVKNKLGSTTGNPSNRLIFRHGLRPPDGKCIDGTSRRCDAVLCEKL